MRLNKWILLFFFSLSSLLSFGQISITENFNDSNFTSQPQWFGDTADFFININKQLQSKANSSSATKSMVIGSSIIDSASWEFFVELNFDPSASNFARVYLSSNQKDLSSSLEGYFVQIGGQSGIVDEVSLFRQDGSGLTKLIDGRDGTVGLSPRLKVQIRKDLSNNWELWVDTSANFSNLIREGSAQDSTYNSSKYFGVYCKYTSSRSDDFFFDDFILTGLSQQDKIRPKLNSIEVLDSNSLELLFSEKLDANTALISSNYFIDGGIGVPFDVRFTGSDSTKLILQLSTPLVNGNAYQLSYENIADSAGNLILKDSITFTYLFLQMAEYRDVVINEFYPDFNPSNGLPEAEFIELLNVSKKIIGLKDWTLSDATSSTMLDSLILRSGEYVIICSQSNAQLFTTYGKVMGIPNFPSLNNSGDLIQIKDAQNNIVDEINYTRDWYQDPSKDDGGYTIEQINPITFCTGATNFKASLNIVGGTPGAQNSVFDTVPDQTEPVLLGYELLSNQDLLLSFNEPLDSNSVLAANYLFTPLIDIASVENRAPQYDKVKLSLVNPLDSGRVVKLKIVGLTDCEGNILDSNQLVDIVLPSLPRKRDIVINEIFCDFSPSVGLPEREFVELYNRSDRVFDLNNWKIEDLSAGGELPQKLFYPGNYLILVSANDTAEYSAFGEVLGVSSFPSLNNGADLIELKDSRGKVIDEVNYTIEWYRDAQKQNGGYSLEQLNPLTDCTGKNNFTASIASIGGTPGIQNSVYDTLPDTTGPVLTSVDVLSNDSLLVQFNERLSSESLDSTLFSFNTTATVGVAQIQEPDLTSILLILSTPIDSGIIHEITVSNLKDCHGNLISTNNSQEIVVPGVPDYRSVVINEFYVDFTPSNGLPEAEFIEIYNASNKIFNLKDWTLGDKTTLSTLDNYIFSPGDYLIICDVGNESAYANYGPTQGQLRFASLNNSGDQIVLQDDRGKIIDQLAYNEEWYGSTEKSSGGYTFEQINPNRPCNGPINFRASTASIGGTPGRVNSIFNNQADVDPPILSEIFVINKDTLRVVFNEGLDTALLEVVDFSFSNANSVESLVPVYPELNELKLKLSNPLDSGELISISVSSIVDCSGNINNDTLQIQFALPQSVSAGDVVINEILFNPRTGGYDFVELFNQSGKILSFKNWSFTNKELGEIANKKTITQEPILFFPNDHIAFTENKLNILLEYPLSVQSNIIEINDLPSYNDDEGTVVIVNELNKTIDEVFYSEAYHLQLLDDDDGVSLERIFPSGSSNDPRNFHSAAESVGFATPGYQNSQHSKPQEFGGNIGIQPEVFSPDQDGVDDLLFVNYQFDKPGYIGTLRIYDQEGRLVKMLANNELLATSGSFNWDGVNEQGTRASIGIYVLLFEVFNAEGETKTFKEPIVLGGNLD